MYWFQLSLLLFNLGWRSFPPCGAQLGAVSDALGRYICRGVPLPLQRHGGIDGRRMRCKTAAPHSRINQIRSGFAISFDKGPLGVAWLWEKRKLQRNGLPFQTLACWRQGATRSVPDVLVTITILKRIFVLQISITYVPCVWFAS